MDPRRSERRAAYREVVIVANASPQIIKHLKGNANAKKAREQENELATASLEEHDHASGAGSSRRRE
jgi:hypothetical protein